MTTRATTKRTRAAAPRGNGRGRRDNERTPSPSKWDGLPPHDTDAELATLGSIQRDAVIALPLVTPILKQPADFYTVKHGWIYAAALALRDRGEPVDCVTLCDELARRGQLDEIGGPAFVVGLDKYSPTAHNAGGYAKIVKDMAARREYLRLASEIGATAYADDFDAQDLEDRTRLTLDALRRDGRRDPWTVHTLADAYAPRPSLQYVVSGLFALPSLSVVYGAPGSLKSFLLADMAACVAGGLSWLAPLPDDHEAREKPVIQSPVMWLDFDNGTRRTAERFAALGRARGLAEDAQLSYVSMPSPWLDASSRDAIGDLADRMTARGVRLVVIDNLGVVAGDAEENSADMAGVMSNLRWLSEQTGAAVVVIHHQRKANGFTGRAGESLRGHSSIEAALDLALLVEREDRASLVTVRSTKTRDLDVTPFGAEFTHEHKAGTHELDRARFFGVVIEDTGSDRAVEQAILEVVEAHRPVTQSKLILSVKDTVEAGKERVRVIANRMVKEHRLAATPGSRGARLYDLP